MGNIVKISENGIVSVRYEYDALGRLTREDSRAFGKTCLWEYDENGNILSRREYAFTVKPTEELTEIEPQSVVEYKYDGDKLISYNGNTQFVYNALGNPTKYNGKSVSWSYGRHMSSYNGKSIFYDGTNIPNKIGDRGIAHDQNGNIVSDNKLHFMYDNEGKLFGFMVRDTGVEYLYRRDALGNIIAVLDTDGNVVVQYKYNAWGCFKVLDANGVEITDTTSIGYLNPFRYRGYYYSDDLGLYYLKSRFYDPEVGRFISADTVDYLASDTVGGLNLYAYCGNNPVMFCDPEGHAPKLWQWVLAGMEIVAGFFASLNPATQSIGVGLIIAGTTSMASNIVTTIGVDEKTAIIVTNVLDTIGGLFLLATPFAAVGASMLGSGTLGIVGGILGETYFGNFELGSAIGSMLGGFLGGQIYKGLVNHKLISFKVSANKVVGNPADPYFDPAVGPKQGMVVEKIQKIQQTGTYDPLAVIRLPNGTYEVQNGNHLLRALQSLGYKYIRVKLT